MWNGTKNETRLNLTVNWLWVNSASRIALMAMALQTRAGLYCGTHVTYSVLSLYQMVKVINSRRLVRPSPLSAPWQNDDIVQEKMQSRHLPHDVIHEYIIPYTLARSLHDLFINQEEPRWRAVIILQGVSLAFKQSCLSLYPALFGVNRKTDLRYYQAFPHLLESIEQRWMSSALFWRW